ncbi:putative lysine-specific demethylase JMJ16 isoform X3 [Tripterygium wilfordii]|uniref:Putative lysine-specific demethylase JMJ16 isoform X3 n=1 Tax=Tripterygium wilfordii TaxID=458696 RepID=A0A7J7BYS7_TRIWF|nr:putative lysine-specific demethylase JMJ16 [Tripterygium wilfordii]XP_038694022.1 putative lysine-specific demethylase JMJ16 [Tripterygium wilfordii]XP_038694023.1 putative lysine-specific demethylase JMJ16 [Tripterygium wilfordii]XP_038694024.1 putative lysine-specific demethylase JMJ16 [Tripterygium wilfordii]KAF5727012.1 putative lysine-specific demethylase JMJ16 isoform X3 [Tripterygium wilfordii]
MGTDHARNLPKNKDADKLSVPPGFMSLSSFRMKKVDNTEETCNSLNFASMSKQEPIQIDTKSNKIDAASLKQSLMGRPWIIYDQNNHHLEESSSKLADKEPSGWYPEDVTSNVLEEAPVFHPTEEEFIDSLKYFASIRCKAEPYGICRIVPPPSWKPPCLLKEMNAWKYSTFETQIQRIDGLQNQILETARYKENTNGKKRKMMKSDSVDVFGTKHAINSDEVAHFGIGGFVTKPGPEFTLESFKENADNFKSQFFGGRAKLVVGTSVNSNVLPQQWEPSVEDIQDEYRRIVESHSEDIEVFYGDNLDTRAFGSGFPTTFNSFELSDYPEYLKSGWNLNNVPRLPGSLLSFENFETSGVLVPRLLIGMCFSSFCWKVEEHHLYSLCYMHLGAPKVWHCVPGGYTVKFEAAKRKHRPELLVEQDKLHHTQVTKLCPSMLTSEAIPVYRCVQHPGEFVLVLPGAYHSGYDCGFNCAEAVNFAPLDWLLHGQNAVEFYHEQARKTSISHDKLLLGAANEVVKAQWEITLLKMNTLGNLKWKDACGKDGILAKALKWRIKLEANRREYLCTSSQSQKMDEKFDATCKRECFICLYDLYLSAACCRCSSSRYSCLIHAKQLCSCGWSEKNFLFRYEINELSVLLEALEGRLSATYRWAKDILNLTLSSLPSEDDLQARGQVYRPNSHSEEKECYSPDAPRHNGFRKSTASSIRSELKARMLQATLARAHKAKQNAIESEVVSTPATDDTPILQRETCSVLSSTNADDTSFLREEMDYELSSESSSVSSSSESDP